MTSLKDIEHPTEQDEKPSYFEGCKDLIDKLERLDLEDKFERSEDGTPEPEKITEVEWAEAVRNIHIEKYEIVKNIGKIILNSFETEFDTTMNDKFLAGYFTSLINPHTLTNIVDTSRIGWEDRMREPLPLLSPKNLVPFSKNISNKNNESITFDWLKVMMNTYSRGIVKMDTSTKVNEIINTLAFYEAIAYISQSRYRDHFSHALRVALVGDYILFKKQIVNVLNTNDALAADIRRAWFLIGVLHDIGYAVKAIVDLSNIISEDFKNLISLNLMNVDNGSSRHGKFSSYIIDQIQGETEDILSIVKQSVLLHDDLDTSINANEEPLAYLLVLIDETQEWMRPVMSRKLFVDNFLSDEPTPLFEIKTSEAGPTKLCFTKKDDQFNWSTIEFDFQETKEQERASFSPAWMLYSKCKNLSRLHNGPSELKPNIKIVRTGFRSELEAYRDLADQHGYWRFKNWLKGVLSINEADNAIILSFENQEHWTPRGIGINTFLETLEFLNDINRPE